MGGIIGSVIGGIGSIAGGYMGAEDAMKGYNYLKQNTQGYVNNGKSANADYSALLTGGPNSPAAQSAFKNYLGSTGYNFQKQQGMSAITGSNAARGILNSGSTGKALVKYGNDLASTGYDNYLSHLNTLSSSGLDAAKAIGETGTTGGVAAGQMLSGGISGGVNQIAGGVAGSNWFGGGGSSSGMSGPTYTGGPVTVTPAVQDPSLSPFG